MSLSLADLIAHVGLENIHVQRVDESCIGARMMGGNTVLMIETTMMSVTDVARLSSGAEPKMHGLVVWFPRDKLPANA